VSTKALTALTGLRSNLVLQTTTMRGVLFSVPEYTSHVSFLLSNRNAVSTAHPQWWCQWYIFIRVLLFSPTSLKMPLCYRSGYYFAFLGIRYAILISFNIYAVSGTRENITLTHTLH